MRTKTPTCILIVLAALALSLPAMARDQRFDRRDFLLDYPLGRPFLGNPQVFGPFGTYSYGGYFPPPPPDVSGLIKSNGLIDEYIAEQRSARESLRLHEDAEDDRDSRPPRQTRPSRRRVRSR
jgi:hypothetical protein